MAGSSGLEWFLRFFFFLNCFQCQCLVAVCIFYSMVLFLVLLSFCWLFDIVLFGVYCLLTFLVVHDGVY